MKLKDISSLLFVTETTKSQYSFLIVFYYMFWMEHIQTIIEGKKSTLASIYK